MFRGWGLECRGGFRVFHGASLFEISEAYGLRVAVSPNPYLYPRTSKPLTYMSWQETMV